MPALPNVPNVVRVDLKYTNDVASAKLLNRLFFRYTGAAGTSAELTTMAANIKGYWLAELQAWTPTIQHLVEVEMVDLTTELSPSGVWVGVETGSEVGQINSAQLAFLVTKTILRRYRGGKPKTFLPVGTALDLATQGTWAAGIIAGITGSWPAFVADIIADASYATFTAEVCVHYYGPPNVVVTNPVTGRARTVSTLRAVPLVDDVQGYSFEAAVATQRRRTGRKR